MEVPPASTNGSTADPWPPQRFRVMCSYGGHIIPRPQGKTLSYIGGDTRIVLVDRDVSLADLHARLTKTLNVNYPFVLKYQLPNEDLDSLISVTTDEDFQNMVEEHDRLMNTQRRLRLFLFPITVQIFDLGQVCGNKGSSDEWFMGVLNGKVKSLSSAFPDSLNCLIGLELDGDDNKSGDYGSRDGVIEGHLVDNEKKVNSEGGIGNQDVNSVPESPMIQTNSSSFGSTSSSKSVKVRALGVEEQFQEMVVFGNAEGNNNAVDLMQQNPKDEVIGVVSDDERSDHGGCRKVPDVSQQVQVPQVQQRQASGGVLELTSPDSVSSEGSITNPMSRQRQTIHQEPTFVQIQSGNVRPDSKIMDQNNTKIQIQPQIQESGYMLAGQYEQHHRPQLHNPQQFVHAGTQYISGGAVPIASYYQYYPSQHQNHPHRPVLDQPYPVYFIQARPTQAYNLPPSYSELAQSASSNQSQKPPTSSNVAHHVAVLNVPSNDPEIVSGGYRTLASSAPQLVQVSPGHHQANYVNYAQIHQPSQSSATNKAAYAYEVADPAHAQMYYTTQPLPPHLAAQYKTMMSSSAVPVQLDASSLQNLTENKVRTVQP